MVGKQSVSLDGYITYIDIGDGLHLGVTLTFDAKTYQPVVVRNFLPQGLYLEPQRNHSSGDKSLRVYEKAGIAISKVACNDKTIFLPCQVAEMPPNPISWLLFFQNFLRGHAPRPPLERAC